VTRRRAGERRILDEIDDPRDPRGACDESQPTLYNEAALWLGCRPPDEANATTSDVHGDETVVRRLYIGEATAAPEGRDPLRTLLHVEMEALDADGTRTNIENRYFVASLPRSRLTDAQWLLLGCPGPRPPPPMDAGAERPRRSPPPSPALTLTPPRSPGAGERNARRRTPSFTGAGAGHDSRAEQPDLD